MMDLVMEIHHSDLKFCHSYASLSHQWTKRNFSSSCFMEIVNQSLGELVKVLTVSCHVVRYCFQLSSLSVVGLIHVPGLQLISLLFLYFQWEAKFISVLPSFSHKDDNWGGRPTESGDAWRAGERDQDEKKRKKVLDDHNNPEFALFSWC